MRGVEDPRQLQSEMDALTERYSQQQKTSILAHYALSLHMLHLRLSNLHVPSYRLDPPDRHMWFLWLAGFILEIAGTHHLSIFYLCWLHSGFRVPCLILSWQHHPSLGVRAL